jgi:hypothetical protein
MIGDTPSTKAARILLLYELRRSGHLAGYNQSEIARVFGVNRSTILRDLRTIDEADKLLSKLRTRWVMATAR